MRRFARDVRYGGRVRLAVLLVAVGAALLAAPSAGAGGQAGFSCPSGFDLGGLTFDQSLALPRVQAGLVAGVYDRASLASLFDSLDKNGDGVLCFQTTPEGNAEGSPANWQYFYNVTDDNSAATTG